ncbi:MAG TPA: type II secretion system protein N [Ideonella sp.]|uniref:type II secretion system protein N n=1 Tax=Ideonella sp. TaxID=1929293 RepID=UPI002E33E9E7|nr:type II secretion system protein N [Ideonella sp.]HEX5687061.1 type II secretion system protein N [Ideonella sp.]
MAKSPTRTGWSLSTFDDSILLGMRRARSGLQAAANSPHLGRWAVAGAVLGGLYALIAYAPAAWLADNVASATNGRLLLAEAEGSLWRGSALPVLTGGAGSKDAAVLPSRLDWSLSPFFGGLRLKLSQGCCIEPGLELEWRPGWGKMTVAVKPAANGVGHWPAAWLEGLGAPWNTLRPGGQLRLATQGLTLESRGGTWQVRGHADLDWLQASSRLSTLDALGSYRIGLSGGAEGASGAAARPSITLRTLEGALQLNGSGQFGERGLKFNGDARAAPGFEPALNNLLNIIGRRNGASSVISIG